MGQVKDKASTSFKVCSQREKLHSEQRYASIKLKHPRLKKQLKVKSSHVDSRQNTHAALSTFSESPHLPVSLYVHLYPHVRSCMDIWPVSWTKWVTGEREKKIKVRAQQKLKEIECSFIAGWSPTVGVNERLFCPGAAIHYHPSSSLRQWSTKQKLHSHRISTSAHT